MSLPWHEPATALTPAFLSICEALLRGLYWGQWVLLTPLSCLALHKLFVGLYARLSAQHDGALPHYYFNAGAPHTPSVTVQLPIFNEPLVVLRLLEAVIELDYPYACLEIQVLDDSTDCTATLIDGFIAALPNDAPPVSVLRRTDRTGFKAGALQAGLLKASGEFIAVFDADFVPPSDFLLKTIALFDDPTVGVVQGRWGFINAHQNLLTRAEAALLSIHFGLEQAGRSAAGLFLNFNGSGGIWRRAAIEASGGWSADTLTEDLDLSYRAQLIGWRFRYVDSIEVPSELPADLQSFCSQQRRWTVGAAQVFRKSIGAVWRSEVPLLVRLDASLHLLQNAAFPLLILSLFTTVLHAGILYLSADFESAASSTSITLLYGAGMMVYVTTMLLAPLPHCSSWTGRLRDVGLGWLVALGMSLHNSAAFLEGLWGTSLPFIRTPKCGSILSPPKESPLNIRSALSEFTLVILLLCAAAATLSIGAHSSALMLSFFAISFLFFGIAKTGAVRL